MFWFAAAHPPPSRLKKTKGMSFRMNSCYRFQANCIERSFSLDVSDTSPPAIAAPIARKVPA